jgi:Zn-finger nucleic acid-binding protein
MDCPVDKNPMIILELNEVEIDYCPSCSGIWLDAGELEILFENQAEREKIISSFLVDMENTEKQLKCPICRRKMDKIFVGEKKELLIDKCPNDDGLWFDRGELKAVLKMGDKDNKVAELLNEIFGTNLKNNQSGE